MHRMTKVHDLLEIWQGSQNLPATQKEACTQHKQMTAIKYISDTEEIVKVSWSNLQFVGAAAFKLSKRSPLPPALCTKYLLGKQTTVRNIRRINRIDHHPADSKEDYLSESISDNKNWFDWNCDFHNPNVSKDNWEADNAADIELEKNIDHPETPEPQDVSAAPNVLRLIRPT